MVYNNDIDFALVKPASEIIADDFNIEFDLSDGRENAEELYKKLRQKLIDAICRYIDSDFEKLLWILYRIDVSEETIKTTLADNPPGKAPEIIADLVLKRELQKIKTRLEYKRKKQSRLGDTDDEERW